MVKLAEAAVSGGGMTSPAEELEALGEEIAGLAAQLNVVTYRLLCGCASSTRARGGAGGFRSCAHWLSWRTGLDLGAAREKVRVARALAGLPALARELERGALSYAKVRALTRVATPANEAELLLLRSTGRRRR